jgi:ABC-type sugar transport system substrate-binding protein
MPVPPGVACDGFYNAQQAADCVIRYLRLMRIKRPNVVVLQGREGSKPRILGFIDKVKAHNAEAGEDMKLHVSVSNEMEFLRSHASKRAHEYLNTNEWEGLNDQRYMKLLTKEPKRQRRGVDVFFCCNDEMALGVCETLERALRADNPVLHKTVVVGFDGIPEATRRVGDRDPWLLNTVDVRVHSQVEDLIERFIPAVKERKRVADLAPKRGELIDSAIVEHVASIRDWRREQQKWIKHQKMHLRRATPRERGPGR